MAISKIIIIADLHINLFNRFNDNYLVLKQISDYAKLNKVTDIWILGDIYNRARPYNKERVLFHKFIKAITDNNIKVTMIAGNHDIDKYQISTIDEFEVLNLPNVKLLSNPSVVNVNNKRIYLGHFLVTGAKLGILDYSVKNAVNLKTILETSADLYLLGDVHKAQKLHSNPDVLYVGSPERIDFGERKEIKGFTLLEIKDKLAYKFIPLKTRPMVQYNINSPQTWLKSDIGSSCNEAIVKIKITCTKECYRKINEKEIREKLKEAHSIKIEYDIIKENRIRNESINESSSSSEAFKNYAKFSKLDKDTVTLGLKVIKETK